MSRTQEQRDRVGELIATLKDGIWTSQGLAEETSIGVDSVQGWLLSFKRAGLVREVQRPDQQRKLWEWVE